MSDGGGSALRVILVIVFIVSIVAFVGFAVHMQQERQERQLKEHFFASPTMMSTEGNALLCDSSNHGRCRGKLQSLDEGLRMTNRDPGSMIEASGADAQDRYGIGQYSNGTMRMYAAADFAPSKITTSFANRDGTFRDVMTVKKDGTVDMVSTQGNAAKLCLDAQCLTKDDITFLKQSRTKPPAPAAPAPPKAAVPAKAAPAKPAPPAQVVCQRPTNFCKEPGEKYTAIDCAGTGTKGDHLCTRDKSTPSLISRTNNCKVSSDLAKCKNLPECKKPQGWCTHEGSMYKAVDCVGNGTKGDHLCTDSTGNKGLISRYRNCLDNWPTADLSKCKEIPVCKRPKDFCTHPGSKYTAVDCLGNGVMGDHICTDSKGNKGMISRANACKVEWPTADFGKCKNMPRIWKPVDKAPGNLTQVAQSGNMVCGVTAKNDVMCRPNASSPWKKVHQGIKNISLWGKKACAINKSDNVFCTNDITKAPPNWYKFPAPTLLKQIDINGERMCGVNSLDNIYCANMNNDFSKVAFSPRAGLLKEIKVIGNKACGVNVSDNVWCSWDIDNPATEWTMLDGTVSQLDMSGSAICGVNSGGYTWCRKSWLPGTPWELKDDEGRSMMKQVSLDRGSTQLQKVAYGVATDGTLKTTNAIEATSDVNVSAQAAQQTYNAARAAQAPPPPPPCNNLPEPTVYVEGNYGGKGTQVAAGRYPSLKGFHDNISSVKVPVGWTLTLFKDENFKGQLGGPFQPGCYPDLGAYGWNDIVSSMISTRT